MLKSNGLRHSKNLPVKFGFSSKTVPANIAKKLPPQRCPRPFLIPFFNFAHKRPTFAFTDESEYTLGFAQRIAHRCTHAETGAFLPPATAQSCATSEITLYVVFVTPDSAALLYTYISRFSENPHYQLYLRPSFIPIFNFSHKRTTFAFTGESGYTLGFPRKIAHEGTHVETGGVSGGVVSLPSERSARSPTSPGRVSERRTLPFLGLGRGHSRRTQRAFGTAMRMMRVAAPRRRGPAGLRDLFSFLPKLRLLRPVPDTSFGSPDAPACAIPVQAASRLVPCRLGAVQGFSVLPLCLTSFFDFGDKKRPPTLCAHGAGQRSDFRCSGC